HSGTIGGLIDLRDNELPAAQSQLDELANQLASSLNAVNNAETAVPPPSTLTGTAATSLTDPLSATGTVRIAVTDSSGNLVSYKDLDLSTFSTVGDLVTALGGIPNVSASVDSNGHLVIKSTAAGDGVAINEMSSSVGANNQGFS